MSEKNATERKTEALNMLRAVLCDPEGKCCITGSDDDRRTVDEALATLSDPDATQITDTKGVWTAWVNTDLTEGRGYQVPIAVCDLEATAIRAAKGKDVQGSNGAVCKSIAVRVNSGCWLAPARIRPPTKEDQAAQKARDEREVVLAKAKAAGLTDEELAVLYGKNT